MTSKNANRLAKGARVRDDDTPASWDDLPDLFEAADDAAQNLVELCEALYRVETEPERRVCLAPVSIATGEYRDRLYSLLERMAREGRFGDQSKANREG